MLIHEFRIILPLTVDEYEVAQLYTIVDMSIAETGGGEGIEVLKNEPFTNIPLLHGQCTSGQYTHKIYHVERKTPNLLKLILPKGSLQVHEESWNAYPYMKTVLTNPGYMKDGFQLDIESLHQNNRGDQENVLQLPSDVLCKRRVTVIDIANDSINHRDYDKDFDPTLYKSTKTGRGPLQNDWIQTVHPVMTCYKILKVHFKWFGLQNRVESYIKNFEQNLFTNFHRRLFCRMDQWYGVTMEDIRRLEEESKEMLDEQRIRGAFKGTRSVSSTVSTIKIK